MITTKIATLTLGLLQSAPVSPAPVTPAPTPAPAPAPEPADPGDSLTVPAEPAPTPAPEPAQIGVLYTPDSAPVVAPPSPVVVEQAEANRYRRLVFSNYYTLNLGLYPIPSGELSVFLGTNLRPRRSVFGTDWNTALGYQMTMSLGYADVYFGESQPVRDRTTDDFFARDPIFFHRHALMAQGYGGRQGRLYYAMGGGAVMWNSLLIGIEAEGKIGYIFSNREGSRLKGILGGQLRLGGPFDSFPLPQLGAFIGFMVF